MARTANKLEAIITRVSAKLVADAVLDSSCIYESIAPDEVIAAWLPNDKAIVITPKSFSVDQGIQTGGGNTTFVLEGTLQVAVWVRYDVDLHSRDVTWLSDTSLGGLKLWSLMVKSLNQYDVTDSGGTNQVLVQPMRAKDVNFAARQVGKWGCISSQFQFEYHQDQT